MKRCFTVNYPRPEGVLAKRYPALAFLPFILDSRPGYHRLGNHYLIDRSLGLWSPNSRTVGLENLIPTAQTMRNYAQWLANFLEWTDLRGVDVHTCNYATHIAGQYQNEMLTGLWSRNGQGLSGTTINLRVQQACDFLTWLENIGKRESFSVPYSEVMLTVGSAISTVAHLGKKIRIRKGKVRQSNRIVLRMPTDS